jgi:hypothetical protein
MVRQHWVAHIRFFFFREYEPAEEASALTLDMHSRIPSTITQITLRGTTQRKNSAGIGVDIYSLANNRMSGKRG